MVKPSSFIFRIRDIYLFYYEKEVITMKKFVCPVCGYVHEMKYKTIKLMLMNELKKETSKEGDDKEEP